MYVVYVLPRGRLNPRTSLDETKSSGVYKLCKFCLKADAS